MEDFHSIPNFDLYGSPEDWDVPGPLHCETIKARSALHDWHIAAHRHEHLHQFLHVRSGHAIARIDGKERVLDLPAIVYVPPMTIHGFRFSSDISGHVLSLHHASLSDALQRTIGLIASDVPYMLLENGRAGKAVRAMASFFQNILNEFKGSNLERTSAIEGNLLLLFTHFVREASKSRQIVIDRKTGEERLVIEFKNLVNKHYEEHRSIAFYAKSLGVTESRLSAACKKVLNRTPKSVCHQRLMLEAMRVLQYTSHSGAQIAYGLGFKDPAYFARFFKTQSGMTPGAYRGSLVGQR